MKKRTIGIMFISLSILCAGCSAKNVDLSNKHRELFPKVESLFNELGIDYKVGIDDNGAKNLLYNAPNETKPNAIKCATFENTDKGINANIDMVLDVQDLYKNDFQFIDSPFYELSKIFIDENIDYTQTNKKINETIENNGQYTINNFYGNVKETITINDTEIYYELNMKE